MIAAALALGLPVGAVLGLVGAGGSIIAVPALVYGVGMSTHDAIPTSLLVVGLSSIAAVIPVSAPVSAGVSHCRLGPPAFQRHGAEPPPAGS